MTELRKNEIYTAEMEGFSSDGAGVCRIGGRAVFVPRALPGETWRVRIVKANRTAAWGRGEERLTTSPHRIAPACPVFGKCGGCACMHMDYEAELDFKLRRINDALRRIGGLDLRADAILGAETIEGYRNKAIYNFAPGPVCGFYRARSHEVIEPPRCLLQPEVFQRTADALLAWMKEYGIPAYDEKTGRGVVRHLFLRKGADALLACIVSAETPERDPVPALRRAVPELTGILLCRNDRPGNAVLTEDIRTLWGSPSVPQHLCGADFELSPLTFFQVNTAQAEKLYSLAGAFARPAGKLVLDLYCGAGTIGLSTARDAARLIGNDIVAAAVENAERNALKNGVSNAEYFCGDASAIARKLADDGLRPDVIIADPPRKGMDRTVLDALVRMAPARIVYVSCDPGTLARDLKHLAAEGYAPEKCTAVDMFPRTSHVETVVQLSKGNISSQNVRVEFSLEDMDMSRFQKGATYEQIQDWVQEKYGFHVTHLNIAQVKRKHGIIERENYNKAKSTDSKQPGCPDEKTRAIEEALRYYQMI